MTMADEIEKLNNLKSSGAITEEEFQDAKKKLLSQNTSSNSNSAKLDVNQWSMFIHISQLANLIIPLAGTIAPIILWQMKKDQSEIIDQQGKNVTNWIITSFILYLISGVLCIVLIGFLFLGLLFVAGIAFSIIGAIKANEGIIWHYPMTIKFIK